MKKIISRGALFSLIVAVLSLLIFISGCGGSEIQGLENSGSTIDGSSVSKSLNSTDKDKSSKQCLYSKVTYTLDNGKVITYQFDPNTLSAVTPSKSGTQETRSSGSMRQAYDGTVMGLGTPKAAYVTDKLVATTNAYTFFPGAGIAEEYIVCPEPSVYPENNVTRQGVTVVPSIESGLGPITYTPTAPSFTGAVHIVANYIIPGVPPKPWHESWEYVYLVDDPVPVLTYYYSEDGNVMGLQFTMGIGSDTENVVLPRTLGDWHFISNNNMSHSDYIINMRELSIKDPVTFLAVGGDSNKIKIQAEIEELSAGSWTANIARAKDEIVNPNTQETTTIDLIWDPATKYLTGDWIYNSGVITAALSKGFSLTAREIANLYMHTIIAYEDTVKTFASKSAGQQIAKLTIENAKATPEEFTPGKKEENNKTNITAQIVANNIQVDTIKWQVTIKDKTDAIVKSFAKRTGASGSGPWNVNEIWDGKIRNKEYVPSGKYTYIIKATAKNGSDTINAEATGNVSVEAPLPKLIKIKFQDPLHLQTDEGEKIKPIYYEQKGDDIIENPVAVTTDIFMEPAVAVQFVSEGSRAQTVDGKVRVGQREYKTTTLVFERPEGLTDYTTVYEFELKDGSNQIINSIPSELRFSPGSKKEEVPVVLVYEHKITRIKGFNVNLKRQGTVEWHTIAKATKTIYNGLGSYKEPFITGGGGQCPTLGLIDIAHYLGNGATTEQEAQEIMLKRLCLGDDKEPSWLKQKHFVYNIANVSFKIKGKEDSPKGGVFYYNKFMYNYGGDWTDPSTAFMGDCEDISAFYALCCSVVGVNMNLARILSKEDDGELLGFNTFPVKSSAFKVYTNPAAPPDHQPIIVDPVFGIQNFQLHQIAQLSNQIWDPSLIFNNPMLAINLYKEYYYTWLIDTPSFQPAYPKPEFSLEHVFMPMWAPSLP